MWGCRSRFSLYHICFTIMITQECFWENFLKIWNKQVGLNYEADVISMVSSQRLRSLWCIAQIFSHISRIHRVSDKSSDRLLQHSCFKNWSSSQATDQILSQSLLSVCHESRRSPTIIQLSHFTYAADWTNTIYAVNLERRTLSSSYIN